MPLNYVCENIKGVFTESFIKTALLFAPKESQFKDHVLLFQSFSKFDCVLRQLCEGNFRILARLHTKLQVDANSSKVAPTEVRVRAS